jgi:hypothetical protein
VWISPDPLRQYHSPYDYCGGDPVNCVDKTGLAGAKVFLETVEKVGGRWPINAKWAGRVHNGIPFSVKGFPDFSKFAMETVQLEGLTGKYAVDEAMALEKLGMKATPDGYVWHHVEDGKTMQMITQETHNSARHTGGAAVIRAGQAAGTAGMLSMVTDFLWQLINPGIPSDVGEAVAGPSSD